MRSRAGRRRVGSGRWTSPPLRSRRRRLSSGRSRPSRSRPARSSPHSPPGPGRPRLRTLDASSDAQPVMHSRGILSSLSPGRASAPTGATRRSMQRAPRAAGGMLARISSGQQAPEQRILRPRAGWSRGRCPTPVHVGQSCRAHRPQRRPGRVLWCLDDGRGPGPVGRRHQCQHRLRLPRRRPPHHDSHRRGGPRPGCHRGRPRVLSRPGRLRSPLHRRQRGGTPRRRPRPARGPRRGMPCSRWERHLPQAPRRALPRCRSPRAARAGDRRCGRGIRRLDHRPRDGGQPPAGARRRGRAAHGD